MHVHTESYRKLQVVTSDDDDDLKLHTEGSFYSYLYLTTTTTLVLGVMMLSRPPICMAVIVARVVHECHLRGQPRAIVGLFSHFPQ